MLLVNEQCASEAPRTAFNRNCIEDRTGTSHKEEWECPNAKLDNRTTEVAGAYEETSKYLHSRLSERA